METMATLVNAGAFRKLRIARAIGDTLKMIPDTMS
jgi:hypothetical protein